MGSVWVFITIGLLLILSGLIVLGTRFGRHPIRPMAVVVFYWSAWILPMIAGAAISFAITEAMARAGMFHGPDFDLGQFGMVDRLIVLVPIPYIALLGPIILFSAYDCSAPAGRPASPTHEHCFQNPKRTCPP